MIEVVLDVLLFTPTRSGLGRAAGTVGLVLLIALLLYVGYGTLVRIIGPAIRELLGGG